MRNKIILIIVIYIFLTPINISTSSIKNFNENILYVDDDNISGPWDGTDIHPYCHIQDAIENASNGYRIFVYTGFYMENVFIDKSITLQGEDKQKTIIDGGGVHDCIYLTSNADGTTITGFTIQNSGDESGGGIFDQGIDIHASYTLITDNIISNHPINGIGMRCSNHNNIYFNFIKDNRRAGIEAEDCRNNIIYRNIFVNNSEWGVIFHFSGISEANQVIENSFIDNFKGMALVGQAGNEIKRNNFLRNQGGHGRSDFTIFSRSAHYTNTWDANYWDNWNGRGRYRISGFFSFDVDRHPTNIPYVFSGGI